ncbi:unnamed protein product [Paramecium sonneborni]|uniref:Uncharacterized protein n=1 Tax=Paramecium sonneborni TaxID=65129 RepID=A0A8S1MFE6_9CILI|nr:unnamed protein product [Paramecium sonneborni]
MGCHCTKTKELEKSQSKQPQIIIQRIEQKSFTQSTSDQIKEDYEDLKPPKLYFISNSNRGINQNHQTEREIGGKKERFSYLYIRPYQKK